ncbi:poly (ADP-ribose) polymerase [Cellulophaga phage phi4:1]|uniref:NAD(+) ADP-ribosyltransferase n=3 Tax=Lightbulbvirus Cba41 TaxID=1918524 RepID=A0A0S2MWG2_9CAUD|nr:polymerase [Cellulophaga phage phi4:1]AGO49444.1 poly (ADP-ribose) polymerase [Cellulophaga phage phi4:1]ALO80040.1 poly (ADP-ribose) polymerase [Cellulophaga phage phi4:1_13]ALO80237.1 poly (ADP-ribose) polymerase [Cellulophaga phage phi4:1_18]
MENKYLIFVDPNNKGTQSNKFYNIFVEGDKLRVEYGRVGTSKTTISKPSSNYNSLLKSKLRKGYTDITSLKTEGTIIVEDSGNSSFDDFYNIFSKYARSSVKSNYIVEGCSKAQLEEAQSILNKINSLQKVDAMNKNLIELFKVIPRRMADVNYFLIQDKKDKANILTREQEALDSMDSANITNVSNPLKELGLTFEEVEDTSEIETFLYKTMGANGGYRSRDCKIHKLYKITNPVQEKYQAEWLENQDNKKCELLIHGTRNPNIFSILKSGLVVRPSNVHFSGAVYGDGIYHSAHSAKSLGYTGGDPDKIFFLQNVHMGNNYTYEGYYRQGKDLSSSNMNYKYLKSKGYDSLFVKPGDGLLNSEYIVYNKEQTKVEYLVWMK